MFENIILYTILGLPILVWSGMLALLLLLTTASVAILNRRGIHTIPFKYHPILARVTIVVAVLHGLAGFILYLG